jgi:hypothetical protein
MIHPEIEFNPDELIKDLQSCLKNYDCIPGAKKNLPLLKKQQQELEHFAIQVFRVAQELKKLSDFLEENQSKLI